jgi:hypothetical protein
VLARYVARQLGLVSKGRGEQNGGADEQHHDESSDERLLEKLRAGGFVR